MDIRSFLSTIVSVLVALFVYGLFIMYFGGDPLDAYYRMFRNSYLDPNGLYETLRLAGSLAILSAGLSLVFKAGIWNIGAEGQYIIGGIAAGYMIYVFNIGFETPVIPILVGMLVGSLYSAVPAYLKYKLDVNEVLTTLMLNYVALYILYYHVYGVWRDPSTFGFPVTPEISMGFRLPDILGMNFLFPLSIIVSIVAYYILFRSKYGFKLRVYGENREAAKYSRYNLFTLIVGSMALSGLASGLAGTGDFLSYYHRFKPGYAAGLGYTAIITTLVGESNPIYTLISSIFFAGFLYGSNTISIVAGVPFEGIYIFEGVLLAFIISRRYIGRWVKWMGAENS